MDPLGLETLQYLPVPPGGLGGRPRTRRLAGVSRRLGTLHALHSGPGCALEGTAEPNSAEFPKH